MGDVVGKILSPVSSLLGGGKTKVIAPPPAPDPAPMPDPEGEEEARRRRAAEARSRSGRLSTILTDGAGETLGG